MYPMPAGWACAPLLLVDQDFEAQVASSSITNGATTKLFITHDQSWVVRADGAAGTRSLASYQYRKGVQLLNTGATSGNSVSWGIDVAGSNIAAPTALVLPTNVYRWDAWIEISAVSYNMLLGMMTSPTGNNYAIIKYDTNTHANWQAECNDGATSTNVNSGIAATSGWHKFTAIYAYNNAGNRVWNFYVDDVLIAAITANHPVSPVTFCGFSRTRTASVKGMAIDRVMVWSNGLDLIT